MFSVQYKGLRIVGRAQSPSCHIIGAGKLSGRLFSGLRTARIAAITYYLDK